MAADGGLASVATSPRARTIRARSVLVRSMARGEEDLLGAIFFRAIHHGAAGAYSAAQLNAWAPVAPSGAAWARRLADFSVVVAECDGRLRGFMAADLATGYLDLAFVEKGAQGTGVAEAAYLVLENRARAARLSRLSSDASHLAKPFFARHGWACLGPQTVERDGVTLENWRMEKALG